MATSITYPDQTGAQSTYAIPFEYLARSHVKVTLDGVLLESGVTFLSTFMLSISPAPVGDLKVYRKTPRDETINVYTDGSVLLSDELNASFIQSVFISQEVGEVADDTASRGWVTSNFGDGGTIQKGTLGQLAKYDDEGNLVPTSVILDPATGSGFMVRTAYDPSEIAKDAYDTSNHKQLVFDNIATKNIPAPVTGFSTFGRNDLGDGGGAHWHTISTPSPVEPWHKQSADGRWWQISKQRLDVRMFGAKIDGVTDDSAAINAGLRLSALYGVELFQPAGTSMQGSTITLPNGTSWVGFNYLSVVKKLASFNGVAVQSENFASLTGTGDAFASGVPERVCIKYITLDGNYQNTERTAYVQTGGEGLQIYARKIQLHLRVFNMQGVGVWLECSTGNGPTPLQPGFSREAEIILYTHQTQYEGLVFKGPPDVRLDWVLTADAGSRIIAEESNGKISSPTYGTVNGNQTYGVVIDGKGAEVGEIHTFGCYAGGGIHWLNGGRINANLLMAERCLFGGIKISGSALGTISKLDVHRTGGFGGDTTPDFIYEGTGSNNRGVEIGVLSCYRQNAAHTGARNGVHVTGDFFRVGVLCVDLGSTATAGHGLYIDNDQAQWITIGSGEVARCKGTAADGLPSAGVYRKTTGNGSMIRIACDVRDCDVAFRSVGTPRVENIDIQFFLGVGQLPFDGDARTQVAQRWDISGVVNGVQKSSRFVGLTAAFASNNITEQALTVAHNLIYAPPFGKYHATGLVDTPTDMSDGDVGYFHVSGADATNVTVVFKMATANSSDTAPRVSVTAEI